MYDVAYKSVSRKLLLRVEEDPKPERSKLDSLSKQIIGNPMDKQNNQKERAEYYGRKERRTFTQPIQNYTERK